jgi:hypothetical protein
MSWCPNCLFDYVLFNEDVKDLEVLKLFVNYHSMPSIVIDIFIYGEKVLNIYPYSITNRGLVYYVGNHKIELEILNNGKIHIYLFNIHVNSKKINTTLLNAGEFNYKLFNDFCQK